MKNLSEKKFEKALSRYFLGEMPEEERKQFLAQIKNHSDYMNRFQDMLILDDLFKENAQGLEKPATEMLAESGGKKIIFMPAMSQNALKTALLTAASLVIGLIFFFRLHDPVSPRYLSTSLGDCLDSQGKSIPNGLWSDTTLRSAEGSICDIWFSDGRNLKLRIFPQTEIRVSRNKGISVVELLKGSLLAETGNHYADEAVFLVMNGFSFEFLGTKIFSTKTDDGKKTTVEVFNGAIRTGSISEIDRVQTFAGKKETLPSSQINDNRISQGESWTPENKRKIMPKERETWLKEQFLEMNSTWPDFEKNHQRQKTAPELQKIEILKNRIEAMNGSNFCCLIYLKNKNVIKGKSIHHKNKLLIVEDQENIYTFQPGDVLKIEYKINEHTK